MSPYLHLLSEQSDKSGSVSGVLLSRLCAPETLQKSVTVVTHSGQRGEGGWLQPLSPRGSESPNQLCCHQPLFLGGPEPPLSPSKLRRGFRAEKDCQHHLPGALGVPGAAAAPPHSAQGWQPRRCHCPRKGRPSLMPPPPLAPRARGRRGRESGQGPALPPPAAPSRLRGDGPAARPPPPAPRPPRRAPARRWGQGRGLPTRPAAAPGSRAKPRAEQGGRGDTRRGGAKQGGAGGGRARPPRGLSPPHSPAGAAPARPRRRRRHPPPRCLGAGGSPGRLPPHLAAWAAAPGPAGGAGQRAAQSMGRVPGGAGGRPRQRREAAGTGQTLKRMSGASSGRGGSDGTAPGGGAGE